MKKFLLLLLSWSLSFSIVWIGLGLFQYYLQSESSFGNFIVGLIGFLIAVNPAMETWEKLFEHWFKIKDK
jgi:hypothetical protein